MSQVNTPAAPATSTTTGSTPTNSQATGFVRGLGLFDSTSIVVGSMIGSGIFIVSADIGRHTGSTGGLLAAWVITGLLTVAAVIASSAPRLTAPSSKLRPATNGMPMA